MEKLDLAYKNGAFGSDIFELKYIQNSLDILKKYLNGQNVLELGCGFGLTTKYISEISKSLTVVDESQYFINITKDLIESTNVSFIKQDWCDRLNVNNVFSDVVLFRGIEHLKDNEPLFNNLKKYTDESTLFHFVIINNNSFHRKLGVYAGVENSHLNTYKSEEMCRYIEYNDSSFPLLLKSRDMTIIETIGVAFKPFQNERMNELPENIQEAFIKIGEDYIKESCEIYYCAKWM